MLFTCAVYNMSLCTVQGEIYKASDNWIQPNIVSHIQLIVDIYILYKYWAN